MNRVHVIEEETARILAAAEQNRYLVRVHALCGVGSASGDKPPRYVEVPRGGVLPDVVDCRRCIRCWEGWSRIYAERDRGRDPFLPERIDRNAANRARKELARRHPEEFAELLSIEVASLTIEHE